MTSSIRMLEGCLAMEEDCFNGYKVGSMGIDCVLGDKVCWILQMATNLTTSVHGGSAGVAVDMVPLVFTLLEGFAFWLEFLACLLALMFAFTRIYMYLGYSLVMNSLSIYVERFELICGAAMAVSSNHRHHCGL
ncbi:hypothetical protein ACLB2K_046582 [Fragaria x ananassa]